MFVSSLIFLVMIRFIFVQTCCNLSIRGTLVGNINIDHGNRVLMTSLLLVSDFTIFISAGRYFFLSRDLQRVKQSNTGYFRLCHKMSVLMSKLSPNLKRFKASLPF